MATPDKSIDPRLFESAKKEFLEKGFEMASLSNICKNAGLTQERYSLYTRLFQMVFWHKVQAFADAVTALFLLNTALKQVLIRGWIKNICEKNANGKL